MNNLKIILTPGKTVSIEFEGRQGEISLAYPNSGCPEASVKTCSDSDVEKFAFPLIKGADHDANS